MIQKPTPRVDDFVDSLQPLASELGVDAVIALVQHFGGTRLYIPQTPRDDSPLMVLGSEVAALLCKLFGPERLDIPKTAFRREALVAWVTALRRQGETNNAIARQLDVGYRFVQEAVAGLPVKPSNGSNRGRISDTRQMSLLRD
jgi:hypothetical protein